MILKVFDIYKRRTLAFALTLLIVWNFYPSPLSADGNAFFTCSLEEYPPYVYAVEGELTGFFVELLRLVFSGSDFVPILSLDSWDAIWADLAEGRIDMCGLVAYTPERSRHILFTEMILTSDFTFFGDSSRISSGGDMGQLRIGVQRDISEILLREELGITEYREFPGFSAALQGLLKGEVDVLFGSREALTFSLIQNRLEDRIGILELPDVSISVAMGLAPGREALKLFIDRRLEELAGTSLYEGLYQKYFFTHSRAYLDKRRRTQQNIFFFVSLGFVVLLFAFLLSQVILRKRIRKTRRRLIEQERFHRITLESIGDGVIATDLKENIVFVNDVACSIMGRDSREVLGAPFYSLFQFYQGEGWGPYSATVKELVEAKGLKGILKDAYFYSSKSGKRFVSDSTRLILDEENNPHGYVVVLQDNTTSYWQGVLQKKLLRISENIGSNIPLEEIFREIYDSLSELINASLICVNLEDFEGETLRLCMDPSSTEEAERITRMPRDAGLGNLFSDEVRRRGGPLILVRRDLEELLRKQNRLPFVDELPNSSLGVPLKLGEKWLGTMEFHSFKPDSFFDRKDSDLASHVSHEIASAILRKQSFDSIWQMAYFDHLTKLPNRSRYHQHFLHALNRVHAEGGLGCVLLFDLDYFKQVNDTHGHDAGDALLQEVGRRLVTFSTGTTVVSRLGGDEFTVLSYGLESFKTARTLAGEVKQHLSQPFSHNGIPLDIRLSMGGSLFPQDGDNSSSLLKRADLALYAAKEGGRDSICFFHEMSG